MNIRNALSIDLEDWYQGLTSTSRRYEDWNQFEGRVENTTAHVLDVLSELDTKATFFVLGHVAEHYPHLVTEIHSQGHEIASHGYRHRLVYEMTPKEFRQDVERSLHILQYLTGKAVAGFRAPAFSIDRRTPWALEILEGLGLQYDSSIVSTRNPLYGWPGVSRYPHTAPSTQDLVELPVSTLRAWKWSLPVGGGFYTRAYPYQLTEWALKRINAQGHPAILYYHPWEFDPHHPRPPSVTLRERVSHFYNLHKTETRFRSLLRTFGFVPLAHLASGLSLG
jgi:polysaccharide deacetylase family protein (PEP-CTERM system associated)